MPKNSFFISILICVLFAFVLIGCGGSPKPATNSLLPGAQPPATAATPPPPPPPSPSSQPPLPPPGSPPPNALVVKKIEGMSNWEWCTATNSHGGECASGLGDATSSKTDNQTSPSLDGSSSKFDIGGPTPYSNVLWWRTLTPNDNATHFVYDLYFYIDQADLPEALEFDVNQSFNGTRWVYGTECSYKDTGKWDVWDGSTHKWVTSKVACPQISSTTWHHLIWQFERVNGQVHYISVTLDNQTYPVDMYLGAESNFVGEGVDVAFQLDGDSHQNPYSVWLNEVTLSEW